VPAAPRLPDGEAGAVLARAIESAGGWTRWQSAHDVGYVSLLTVVDPLRDVSTDTIGWFSAPLHAGLHARMDSIGLPTQVQFGIDAEDTWILSDGMPVTAPGQLAVARFDMLTSVFWFSLPFALAEGDATVTYAGEQRDADGTRWQRLRVEFPADAAAVPGPWFVLWFDGETGLIDHVHAQLTAPFLRHDLWVGYWRQYRDCDGFRKERQRQFFPADADGAIVGAMVAEQFIERIQFNNGYRAERFARPTPAARPGPESPPPGGAPMHAASVAWTEAR
jgi:hypothetical protein